MQVRVRSLKVKVNLIYTLIGAFIGAAVIWQLYPRIEEKLEYKDRVKVETRVVTRIVERKSPDGSSETTTEITDIGSSTHDTSLQALKLAQKQYVVGAGASFTYGHFEAPEYNLTVGRRLIGPVLGAVTVSKERVMASLLVEF